MKKREIKFTPWRLKYLEGSGISDCFVCEALKQKPDPENLVIVKTENVAVMLNRYPYSNGHLMIIPVKHVPNLQSLEDYVLAEMMKWLKIAESILENVYSPNGFNVGINIGSASGAGLATHLHIHILPRWSGDTNFMTSVGDVRVVPEELHMTWHRLEPLFRNKLEKNS